MTETINEQLQVRRRLLQKSPSHVDLLRGHLKVRTVLRVHHFNLFSTSNVAEDEFLNILTTNTVAGIPQWDMCSVLTAQ